MNNWQFLMKINKVCSFMSRERTGKASNSELKRWLMNKAVIVDGKPVIWNNEVSLPIASFVLFPKKPITIW